MKVQERKQWRITQLDEFWEIGEKLSIKEVSALQETQEGKREIAEKMVEHPITHDLMVSQVIAEKFKE